MGRVILSIDQGTTGTSALLINRAGRVVGHGYAELPQHYPRPGWVEHNPQEILETTRNAIKRVLDQTGISAKQIESIGITNQRETTLLWHRDNGEPIANAIVWQCRRTSALCERLRQQRLEPMFRRKTGLVIDAYFSGTKIRWLLDHIPRAKFRARRGELAFGTVDSWLTWNLTGGKIHATDYTNASRTLLYNINTKKWDQSLLRRMGVPSSLLPDVVSPSGHLGVTTQWDPLPAGIPITGMAGDQQASMVGHGCLAAGSAKNTYGTGCFLLLNTGSKIVNSRHGLITTLVYGGKGQPSYALEGSVFIAGAAVQWLRDGLRFIKDSSETEAIARSIPDTEGVYVVPAFVGLGSPYWDMDARGAIIGLTRGTTREIIIRATLESMAYQTRDVVHAMQKDSGIHLKQLQVDGGAAQNNWLMQFQADILGIPIVRPAMVANTGLGAGILAGIGIGWWKPADVAKFTGRSKQLFNPNMSDADRHLRYQGWQEAVERVRTVKKSKRRKAKV